MAHLNRRTDDTRMLQAWVKGNTYSKSAQSGLIDTPQIHNAIGTLHGGHSHTGGQAGVHLNVPPHTHKHVHVAYGEDQQRRASARHPKLESSLSHTISTPSGHASQQANTLVTPRGGRQVGGSRTATPAFPPGFIGTS